MPQPARSRQKQTALLALASLGSAVLQLEVPALDLSSPCEAAERPTLNRTCDPRPDILPHPIYYATTEYRRAYNRPRFSSGWIADKIAPTSQEALVWRENLQEGRYDGKDCPAVYKTYYYPKPWEVLQTGPRPDTTRAQSNNTLRPAAPAQAYQSEMDPTEKRPAADNESSAVVPSPLQPVPPNAIPAIPQSPTL